MKEKFEKNVEEKLSSFRLEPSPQVWQEVESALHSRRKDRRIIWWWLPLLGLLVAGGWWIFNNKPETKIARQVYINQTKNSINKNEIANKSTESKNIISVNTNNKTGIKKSPVIQKPISVNPHIIHANKSQTRKRNISENERTLVSKENKSSRIISTTPITDSKNESLDHNNVKEQSSESLKTIFPKNTDTINSADKKTTNPKDSSSNNTIVKKINPPNGKNKKQSWWITIGSGITHTSQSNLFSNLTSFSASSSSAPGVTPGGSTNATTITKATNGLNLQAGLLYQYQINKRWLLNTGLLYRYLQNKQTVGTDSSSQNAIFYARAGNTSLKTNYAHWLQLPVELSFSINSSDKNKFQVFVGGSLAWSIAEKWLAVDPNNYQYPYYYNSSLNNRFIMNLHTGIDYNFNDRFQISLLAEQSLTPIHKYSFSKDYLNQFSLQISKPLKQHKKNH